MSSIIGYRKYIAKIEYSPDDKEFVGTVQNTQHVKENMAATIDSHLVNCKELNIAPNKWWPDN